MSVINIHNRDEFEEKVINADKPVLVDFWAPWCGPCKMVSPEVEAVAESFAGRAYVVKVNVDDHPGLANDYHVMGVPTILIIKNGREINRIVGYRPRQELSAALENTF